MVFMLVYYKLSGINAIVALVFNLVILLGLMAYIGATMTLPGIAGFVLTMGVGVDSNVLIFERIKEELAAQRGVRAAINAGFSRVFLTLLDTHIASLISALFLFQFGTGPIRGFATTLSIGLFVNLFTSIFVSKTLYEMEMSAAPDAGAEHLTSVGHASREHGSLALHAYFQESQLRLRPLEVARDRPVVGRHPGRRCSSSGPRACRRASSSPAAPSSSSSSSSSPIVVTRPLDGAARRRRQRDRAAVRRTARPSR